MKKDIRIAMKTELKLTVIIRNDAPIRQCQDNPSYRSVTIELTEKQMGKLDLKYTDNNLCDTSFYEEISQCFLEPLNSEGKERKRVQVVKSYKSGYGVVCPECPGWEERPLALDPNCFGETWTCTDCGNVFDVD